MNLFNTRYRIASARLPHWDYSTNGFYFITICAHDRKHFFGEVKSQKMNISNEGEIVNKIWHLIPEQFPHIQLDSFIIMPNHIHGILVINNRTDKESVQMESSGGITGEKNPMVNESISRALRWFKGRCTFEIKKFNPEFRWQSRFHDHIIRDKSSYDNIRYYILNNPAKWMDDYYYE